MKTGDELQIKFNKVTQITKIELIDKNVKTYYIKYINENGETINYKVIRVFLFFIYF